MKLTRLITNKYTRLYVTGINYIDYIPKHPMQIILASNGAGKSSLLKEIIPNVEDLNLDYEEDGYRIAEYSHNGKAYILAYFREKNKHSFKVDNIELNEPGLKKIQKMLIEEHFGINKYVHELLLSTTSFTTMSISERKRWFTEIITTIDYKHALDKYGKVKQQIRDITSYIKLTQSKLIQDEELFKTMDDIYIANLENDKKKYLKIIDELLDKKLGHTTLIKPDTDMLCDYNYKITSLLKNIDSSLSIVDINKHISSIESEITLLRKRKQDIESELEDIDENLVDIDDTYNTKDIKKQLNDIYAELSKYDYINPSRNIDDLLITLTVFNDNYTELSELAISISEYSNITGNINELKSITERLSNKMSVLKDNISNLEKEYNLQLEYSKQDDVNCPKCSYVFKPNFDVDKINLVKEKLYKLRDELIILEKEFDENKTLLNKLLIKENLILKFFSLLKNSKQIYEYFKDTDITNISGKLSDLYIQLPKIYTIESYRDTVTELSSKLTLVENMNLNNISRLQATKDKLITDLHKIINRINILNNEYSKYKKQQNLLNTLKEYSDVVESMFKKHIEYDRRHEDKIFNEYINSLVKELKEEIYVIESQITKYYNVKEHYKNLQSELDKYTEELEMYKKIEELLSPSKGIIGKTITDTINIVLEKMNFIINQVWEQEITILPCDVSESDLTFRFPVKINNIKTIPDIIKGSASIKEIIDLAFKITAMELLNMLDYPLILDEFSKTMDMVHRIKSYNYIERLSKEHFSQIFMVSHYEEMFLRFAESTDVVVLNNDNIKYTGKFNEIIEIKG